MSKHLRHLPLFLGSVLLSACGGSASSLPNSVAVTLVDCPFFSASEQHVLVSPGEDVTLRLTFQNGFSFSSCDYPSYVVAEQDGVTSLLLKNVLFPTRVHVNYQNVDNGICYYLNGGRFISSALAGDCFVRWNDLSHHTRANTAFGTDLIQRPGYIQIGWNTRADGSGNHIGLGSRISCAGSSLISLYAEWAQETPTADFAYESAEGGVILTGYHGPLSLDDFALPRTIDGQDVIGIRKNFVQGVVAKRLILSEKLQEIQFSGFSFCQFNEIIFSDSLTKVTDSSFIGFSFPTWHLNASRGPVYQGQNDNARFSDDMDRLILHQNEKKLVLFGGCSVSYGLKSELLAKQYPAYCVCDMGVIGGTNAAFQFDCLAPYLHQGDVVVHAPEVGSGYQLMANTDAEARMFVAVEGNYDLLSWTDMSAYKAPFTTYFSFCQGRSHFAVGSYSDYLATYNDYGDITIERPLLQKDESLGGAEYTYEMSFVTAASLQALKEKYARLSQNGAKVYFSFSPVNLNGMNEKDRGDRVWDSFEAAYRSGLPSAGYPVISRAVDYLLLGRYFYDTNYHLNDQGALIRTQRLIVDLTGLM